MNQNPNQFNNGRKFYDCPGQTGTLKTSPPIEERLNFNFGTLKEPGPGPERKQMEDQATQAITTPQAENLPTITATALTRFDVIPAALAEIKGFQSLVVDLRDKQTFKDITAAKSKVRALRLKIQNREKDENAKLNKSKADLKKDATTIKAPIKGTEDYLAGELKKWTDEQARLQRIEDEKEAARKKIVNQNFDCLVKICNDGLTSGLSSADIKTALDVLNVTTTPQTDFHERYQDACNHLSYAIENTQRAYNDAVTYENRQAEMARIQTESERVDQVAWFNENFGILADLETMEAGLKNLEAIDPTHHLSELITEQIKMAGTIIEKTRAAQPDPVEETPAPEKKTPTKRQGKKWAPEKIQVNCNTEILTEGFKETAGPQEEKTLSPDESNFLHNAQLLENFKTIDSIINAASPGSLELILSNGQASAPIMLSPEGLNTILALIKTKFEKAVKG